MRKTVSKILMTSVIKAKEVIITNDAVELKELPTLTTYGVVTKAKALELLMDGDEDRIITIDNIETCPVKYTMPIECFIEHATKVEEGNENE